ncbi:glucose-6-phosphate dehydrogenase [Quadrisphaera sp. DSM 44207]|uniref:glucose-6-phosphate dehydrogenase n=1 Tax=Quadrisphaera sp. DSM 44207 TaxID=1881057 RepID=UPI000889CCEF|nr:glucose-6-phosphate dehydrogenase [Quadrisphaera sp. DSM 44207]SDQ12449.1 glucose-6-phosphate 1-dehydrogenase [Quadrisphaera sp. DSM 44207]
MSQPGEQPSDRPVVFVLYGATGDLARRLVLPSFAALHRAGRLPRRWALVGSGRSQRSDDDFRAELREAVDDDEAAGAMAPHLHYAGGGFAEDDPGQLLDVLGRVRGELGDDVQLVHYLALPPSTFAPYTRALAAHGLTDGARVVYEKPYGRSAGDFEELDALVRSVLEEEQVFRIDHFLGKEATQQLHVLRFANRVLEQVWSREHVAAVQIDVPETLDVADRAEFYDETGAVLDMLVTHLVQVAAEVALEPPAGPAPEDLQTAREAVIAAFRPIDPDDVVLGQAQGYLDLPEVADGSTTDTFVAARMLVDTDRWRDVPFLMRTGKRLAGSAQQVHLVLREPDTHIPGAAQGRDVPEVLTVDLKGSGGVEVRLTAARPGFEGELVQGTLRLDLAELPEAEPFPAYAALLLDVLRGNRALFTSAAGLREAWRVVDPLLAHRPPVQPYAPGTWGPRGADELAAPHGWLTQAGPGLH